MVNFKKIIKIFFKIFGLKKKIIFSLEKLIPEISETEKYEDTNNMDLLKKYLTKFFPFSQKEREADKKIK